jgi:hypothetical protein
MFRIILFVILYKIHKIHQMMTTISTGLFDFNKNDSMKTPCIESEQFKQKPAPMYTFVKEFTQNVCLCVDCDDEKYIAKHSRKTDQTLIKEIRLTQLLSCGSCDVLINTQLLKNQSDDRPCDSDNDSDCVSASVSAGAEIKKEINDELFSCDCNCDCNESGIDHRNHKTMINSTNDNMDVSQLQKTCYSIYTFFANHVNYIGQVLCANRICVLTCCSCMSGDDIMGTNDDDCDDYDIENIYVGINDKTKLEIYTNTNQLNNNYVESLGNSMYKFKISNDAFNYDYFCRFVSIYSSFEKSYLIMKYSGEDLCDYISNNDKKMHESYAKNIFKHIVLAVKTLHCIGMAHGDLSPENICIVNPNDQKNVNIYLIDYEYTVIHRRSPYYHLTSNCTDHIKRVIVCDCLTKTDDDYKSQLITKLKPYETIKDVYGKEYYISPERMNAHFESIKTQTSRKSYYCSYKDDIYALGIILFTMLSGQLPYKSPIKTDHGYCAIITGLWKKNIAYEEFVSENNRDAIDLIDKILKPEKNRLSLDQILDHRWLRGSNEKS